MWPMVQSYKLSFSYKMSPENVCFNFVSISQQLTQGSANWLEKPLGRNIQLRRNGCYSPKTLNCHEVKSIIDIHIHGHIL